MEEKIKENAKKILDLLFTETPAIQNEIIKIVLCEVADTRNKNAEQQQRNSESAQADQKEFFNNLNLKA